MCLDGKGQGSLRDAFVYSGAQAMMMSLTPSCYSPRP